MLAAASIALTACGGSLKDRDPEGAASCQALVDGRKASDTTSRMGSLFLAGEHAAKAKTKTIRASSDQVLGQWMADSDKLAKACEAEGYEVPAVTPADG